MYLKKYFSSVYDLGKLFFVTPIWYCGCSHQANTVLLYYYIPVHRNTVLLSSHRGCSKDKIQPTLVLRPSTKVSLLLFRQFCCNFCDNFYHFIFKKCIIPLDVPIKLTQFCYSTARTDLNPTGAILTTMSPLDFDVSP